MRKPVKKQNHGSATARCLAQLSHRVTPVTARTHRHRSPRQRPKQVCVRSTRGMQQNTLGGR